MRNSNFNEKVFTPAVPGVAFLSGGQHSIKATARLNAMHLKNKSPLPRVLPFSFSRAIEYLALKIWNGNRDNKEAAQKLLYHRAGCDNAARRGQYTSAMENE